MNPESITSTSNAPAGVARLAERYHAVRAATLALTEKLSAEDMQLQSMPDASPAKWHLAHTTWFFETFLLQAYLPGYQVFHPQFNYLFNSYYQQIGPMHQRPERGLLSRPGVAQILAYRAHVDGAMQQLLVGTPGDPAVTARVVLGLNHEQQHQELLLTDIKHALSCNPLKPAFHNAQTASINTGPVTELQFLTGANGIVEIGCTPNNNTFAYDNETPRHKTLLHPHAIANRLVTNAEYKEFIESGGYDDPALWLSDGWTAMKQQDWQRPLYWQADLGNEFTLSGLQAINPAAPVAHISFYEADAFARWAGYRLPTEAEWEHWASDYSVAGNFADSGFYQPQAAQPETPQVFGDVWQWTMSPYTPYPGFKPATGALGEYNGKFMCNQMVLRGGSCVTPLNHMRASYRNFFYPDARWQFSGLRLAKDL
ncbi:MAG TPA: ergothioneine biosynthesis protein EgtB [Gammaproteobacteria bacterium]|nr:ergothioneine biosynthesis protein EgtB [Gammaproteobacteria bacterium]